MRTRILDSDGDLKPGVRKNSDAGDRDRERERERFPREGAADGGTGSLSLSLTLFRANSSIPRAPSVTRSANKYVTDIDALRCKSEHTR